MKHYKRTVLALFICLILTVAYADAREEKEIRRSFTGKKMVQLNTMSGDCIIKGSTGDELKVRFVHTYSNTNFEPQFKEEGTTLILKEKFRLSGSGNSVWYLVVPEGTEIKVSSISGDISIKNTAGKLNATTVSGDVKASDCKGTLEFKSASGDVDVENMSGDVTVRGASSDLKVKQLKGNIEVKTASGDVDAIDLEGDMVIKSPSGDIEIKNAAGTFNIKTASGEIHATDIQIKNESFFKTASGDIQVTLAKSATKDLHMDTASGDVTLNYNGNPIEGYFEFKVDAKRGDIIAPFPFEKEEEIQQWGKKYLIKGFKREIDIPKIYISTASGTAILKEK
jgi:DUF4097 and DUF4098 domain-containing protein YvlB